MKQAIIPQSTDDRPAADASMIVCLLRVGDRIFKQRDWRPLQGKIKH